MFVLWPPPLIFCGSQYWRDMDPLDSNCLSSKHTMQSSKHKIILSFLLLQTVLSFNVRRVRRRRDECESETRIIYPSFGQSVINSTTMAIVQDGEHQQPVKIVTCVEAGSSCAQCQEKTEKVCANTHTVSCYFKASHEKS